MGFNMPEQLWTDGLEHVGLVGTGLSFGVVAGVPLGLWAAGRPWAGRLLGRTSLLARFPALAALGLLTAALYLSNAVSFRKPCAAAVPGTVLFLCLANMLGIAQQACRGRVEIPVSLHDTAEAMGLPYGFRFWRIELPLAGPAILCGMQAAARYNIALVTIAAAFGAGGLGQWILEGADRGDFGPVLQGCAAVFMLGLAFHGFLTLIGRLAVSRGLRIGNSLCPPRGKER